jgi:hypothetical protein
LIEKGVENGLFDYLPLVSERLAFENCPVRRFASNSWKEHFRSRGGLE